LSAAEPWQGEWEKNVRVECAGEANGLPAVDCLWSGFSDWSECSSSCGEGLQERKRKVLQTPQDGGLECVGPVKEERKCQSEACTGKIRMRKTLFVDDFV
jgi:hypothetical protein